MIRVVYRWYVEPENFKEFRRVWSNATDRIYKSAPGALGRCMLKRAKNKSEVLTIANWDSLKSWENFWGNENPREMEGMLELGIRASVEVYEQIDDRTREK